MANDKPKNVISVADLDDVGENPDPVRVALKSGKMITFPDVFDLPTKEAERFFREVELGMRNNTLTPALERWLSKDDFAALDAAFPTFRKLNPVVHRVMQKYEAQWGSEGEEGASAS